MRAKVSETPQRYDILEKLYYGLEKRLEEQARHIGNMKDTLDVNAKETQTDIEILSSKVNKKVAPMLSTLEIMAEKVEKHSERISKFEAGINAYVKKCIEDTDQKILALVDMIETNDSDTMRKMARLSARTNTFEDEISKSNREFTTGTTDKLAQFKQNTEQALDKICKNFSDKVEVCRREEYKNTKDLWETLKLIKDDIDILQNLKVDVSNINSKNREDVLDSVNDRLNNFMDDVRDRLELKEGGGVGHAVLKRLAHLEGVREAISNRKSAKEVVAELEEMKLSLLRAEKRGEDCRIPKARVETLMWILGRTDG